MSKMYKKLSNDPDAYYRALLASGWLDEWTDEEMSLLHNTLHQMESPEYAVFTLSEYTMEPDGISTPDKYREEILKLFSAFGIPLSGEDVKAFSDEGHIVIKVNTPKQECVWRFYQEDNWLHDDFIDFINEELLPHWREKRLFHPLPPAAEQVELVFHYPEVIEDAIERGIIPDDDYFLRLNNA